MKPLEYRVYTRDGYRCQMCDTPYRGHRFNHFEIHHIIPRAQLKKLGLTSEQRVDIRNQITLCFKCHQLTYKKRGRSKDPHFLEKLTKLEKAKRQISFYIWFAEVKITLSPNRRQLLCPPEIYGITPLPRAKHKGPKVNQDSLGELEQEIDRLDSEFKIAILD